MSKSAALILFAFASLALLGAFALGRLLGPQYDAADIAKARRVGGDSATAEVSARYLKNLVAPLRDSIAFYKAKPQAGAKIVIRHDTVSIRDSVSIPLVNDSAFRVTTIIWPLRDSLGVVIAESTLVAARLPISAQRRLHVSLQPDTVIAALLSLPDGTQRFTAIVKGYGYAQVTDAATLPQNRRRFGFHCTLGPGAYLSTDATVRVGVGAQCGLGF